jgi:hypothetical protein
MKLVSKDVHFIFQTTQQFIKSVQMTYLHEGRISEAQHVSTPNGSSSGVELMFNMDPYFKVVLSLILNLSTVMPFTRSY